MYVCVFFNFLLKNLSPTKKENSILLVFLYKDYAIRPELFILESIGGPLSVKEDRRNQESTCLILDRKGAHESCLKPSKTYNFLIQGKLK